MKATTGLSLEAVINLLFLTFTFAQLPIQKHCMITSSEYKLNIYIQTFSHPQINKSLLLNRTKKKTYLEAMSA